MANQLPSRCCHGTHLQHLMLPCWFILLFISGVPFARRFYFCVRAFGTTQSLLFISFTKPSMTTLPSSSSKVKHCFLFEWYSRHGAFGTKRKFFNSQYNFKVIILFYLFRVGRDKDVQLRKQANGLSSSHFRFRFQSVYKYQPCSLRSQLGW
jgi:hypothetical protein